MQSFRSPQPASKLQNRPKRAWFWCVVVGLLGLISLAGPPTAQAQAPSPPSDDRNRPFGLGIIAGEPTGLSGKYWLSPRNAVDFAAAWSFGNDDSFHLHATYLWHELKLLKIEKGTFDLYYGIGARVVFDNDTRVGGRVPIGLAYRFRDPSIEIFLELAPILDLAPSTELDLNGGVGFRFYF